MANRWGGRGRGRRGGIGGRQEPFIEFPEVELPDPKHIKIEKELATCYTKLHQFWKNSCYHLEDETVQSESTMHVERYSDRGKQKTIATRDSIHKFLHYTSGNFPKQLIGGMKRRRQNFNNVRWDPSSDMNKLQALENLEENEQEKQNKEDEENKEEDEEEQAEAAEEDSSDDDYQQNEYFDDDDDDYNQASDGEDNEQIM